MEDIPICECATFWQTHHDECPVRREVESLRAELAEARRDAERYRWLRSDDCPFSCYEQEGPDNWGWCPTSSRDLDEAIDAAMAGGEK